MKYAHGMFLEKIHALYTVSFITVFSSRLNTHTHIWSGKSKHYHVCVFKLNCHRFVLIVELIPSYAQPSRNYKQVMILILP